MNRRIKLNFIGGTRLFDTSSFNETRDRRFLEWKIGKFGVHVFWCVSLATRSNELTLIYHTNTRPTQRYDRQNFSQSRRLVRGPSIYELALQSKCWKKWNFYLLQNIITNYIRFTLIKNKSRSFWQQTNNGALIVRCNSSLSSNRDCISFFFSQLHAIFQFITKLKFEVEINK